MSAEFEDVKSFCQRTGLSRSTVERRIADGTLVVYRAGSTGKRLIEIAAANRVLRRCGRGTK